MKTFKRFLVSMLCVVIVLTAAPLSGFVGLELPDFFCINANAALYYNGYCGDNVKWSLDTKTGVLNITGTGAMEDYDEGEAPQLHIPPSACAGAALGCRGT